MSSNGDYIVVFKEDAPDHVIDAAIKDVESKGGKIKHRYDTALKGFAANIHDDHLSTLNSHEQLNYIEADGVVTTQAKSLGIK